MVRLPERQNGWKNMSTIDEKVHPIFVNGSKTAKNAITHFGECSSVRVRHCVDFLNTLHMVNLEKLEYISIWKTAREWGWTWVTLKTRIRTNKPPVHPINRLLQLSSKQWIGFSNNHMTKGGLLPQQSKNENDLHLIHSQFAGTIHNLGIKSKIFILKNYFKARK